MNEAVYARWRHVFKLDPDRNLSDEALEAVCTSGTDAIMVGGSSGITYDNLSQLLARIRRYDIFCALEVSSEEAAVAGFDHYFIPLVLNSPRAEWLAGRQIQALRTWGAFVPWERTSAEGYLILNARAEAAIVTEAEADLDPEGVAAHIYMADRLMRLPVVYIEYSGIYGDMALVKRVRGQLSGARLFYGGGVDDAEKAAEAAQVADTVIVGNAVYECLPQALATVEAVRRASAF